MTDNTHEAPRRVLHVTEELSAAGIESFIMNMYRRMDREQVQFDFLVTRDVHEFYDDEIAGLGGHKYCVVSQKSNILFKVLDESRLIEDFLKDHPYDIVHIHTTTTLRAPYLRALKRAGVRTRIYHSHSAYVPGKSSYKYMMYDFFRHGILNNATDFFACSAAAGEWIFGAEAVRAGQVRVMPNGLDSGRFGYHPQARERIRKQLGLYDQLVLVHTGRFTEQKNQSFLIQILAELHRCGTEADLILLGDGPMREEVEALAKGTGTAANVHFAGVVSNVEDYLSAGDIYVMPSLYEGLPVSGIEAQCAGLPCIFSDRITDEVSLTGTNCFIPPDAPVSEWKEAILSAAGQRNEKAQEQIKAAGYDVIDAAAGLQEFYLSRYGARHD